MVFLTRFGAYSAISTPAFAGTMRAMPRAWPSFRVAAAFLLTKVCSIAASSGRYASTTCTSASWSVTSRTASAAASSDWAEPQAM